MTMKLSLLRIPALLVTLAVVLGAPTDAAAARRKGPPLDGAMLSQSCFACHGPDGTSMAAPMPTIGGQQAVYLTNVLSAFRSGDRTSTMMGRLMRGYSDAEIEAIATYLSSLPYRPTAQTIDPAKVELGRKGYARVCKKCHLDNGRDSSEPDYPRLAGQWLPYLQLTMGDILTGQRKVDEKFSASLEKLSKDEIDAVLHFFAAQQ